MISRRSFIRKAALGGALIGSMPAINSLALPYKPESGLYTLCARLVQTWGEKLISLQVTDSSSDKYGGIVCPTYNIVHGRIGDTIYPFFHLAHTNKESKYMDASVLLYRWMEKHVSQDDGSWLNEPIKGSWKGTTVFSIIALAETLKHHGGIMDPSFKNELTDRLAKAGDFVYNTFTIDYGNINYPIAASYGLTLLGDVLDISKYKTKGRALAHEAMKFFTSTDKLIFGEGDPYYEKSKKGCLSVDLGYNVEESLPSLVQYALLTDDAEVLQAAIQSMQAHMEFMLPDGGWDNSWGTRNYKWTYWGSRTSDGCQPAYGLLAHKDHRFYTVALRNTQLLEQSTKEGLLYGGPHYALHGIPPSIHHTFCHIKALTTLLDHPAVKGIQSKKAALPREQNYGSKFFSDIQTVLIAKGKFRATITCYDLEYKKTKNGHASGGALTLLWHEKSGVLLCGSMNEYQLFEAGNMQTDNDSSSMSLTPRIELRLEDSLYMNISDLDAQMEVNENSDGIIIETRSRLVDRNQNAPLIGAINCGITYFFSNEGVSLHYWHDRLDQDDVRIVFPVIASSLDKITLTSDREVQIEKEKGIVKLSSTGSVKRLIGDSGRVFNYVPGLEAVPFELVGNDVRIEIRVNGK